MRRHAIIGALLLIGLGVALGATVFRTDIAQATGLAQSVTVSNTPAQAVPVREQATQQPVQARRFGSFPNGDRFSEDETLYTVPEGKTLVIEAFTAGSNMSASDEFEEARLSVELTGFSDAVTWYLHPVDEGVFSSTGARIFNGSAVVRAYAGPGTTVEASAVRDGTSLSGTSVEFGISGYLVDTP
jgi:hypothetical protein